MNYKRSFNIKDSGNAFLAGWLTMFGLQLVVTFAFSFSQTLMNQTAIIANQAAFLLSSLIYCRNRHIALTAETGLKKKPAAKQYLLLLPISVLSIGAFLPLATWFVELLKLLGYPSGGLGVGDVFSSLPAAIICLCVFPAIGEEIFIRGTVMNGLKNRGYSFAIIASAALFSIMHGSALQTVHQFGLGLVLAYIAIASGDIKTAMVLHFLNNLISILSDILIPQLNDIAFAWWQIPVGLAVVLFSMVMLLLCLKCFTDAAKKKSAEHPFAEGTTIIDVYPDGRAAYGRGLLSSAFNDFFSLFKRGGLRKALKALDGELAVLAPLPPAEKSFALHEVPLAADGFLQRDTKIPASLILAFIAVTLVWLVQTSLSFAGMTV